MYYGGHDGCCTPYGGHGYGGGGFGGYGYGGGGGGFGWGAGSFALIVVLFILLGMLKSLHQNMMVTMILMKEESL